MRPWLCCGEVGHKVLRQSPVHLLTSAYKRGTCSVPAGMGVSIARGTADLAHIGADPCPMSVPAGVISLWACVGNVTPALALQAPCGFLFALFCIYLFLTYDETVGQDFVGYIRNIEGNKHVSTSLTG